MRYQGLQPPDDELQRRHEERNRMVRETLTLQEAADRYGLTKNALRRRLYDGHYQSELGGRYRISDIEEVVATIKRQTGRG